MNNERNSPIAPSEQCQQTSLPFSPIVQNGVNYYLGIPYATAQRFRYPSPLALTDLPAGFTACTPAPGCPQPVGPAGPNASHPTSTSEDCLKLSIVTPTCKPAQLLPVIVFFHGGSYLTGGGDAPGYDPYKLVMEQEVIVVKVTYRLGLLGFIGSSQRRPANLGLVDALTALGWVKKHIKHFGGNPDCVTAWGQSAGGDLLARLLLTSPLAQEHLVHRAIIQSTPLELAYRKEKLTAHILKTTQDLHEQAPAHVWAQRGSRYFFANPLRFGWSAFLPLGCQFGAYPLPAEDQELAHLAQIAAKVPLLVGNMTREAAGNTPDFPTLVGNIAFVCAEPLIRWLTGKLYTQASQHFAEKYRQAGGQATVYSLETGSHWHYRRSAHSADLSLFFDSSAWDGSALRAGASPQERRQQGLALRAVWAHFAKTGSVQVDLLKQARISLN